MITGKYQHLMSGYFPHLFQNSDGLTGEQNDMWSAHFSATHGIADSWDSFTSGWNVPEFACEIDLRAAGKT